MLRWRVQPCVCMPDSQHVWLHRGYGRHVDADVSCPSLACRAAPAQVLKEVCMRGDFIHAEALK